jgi:hypothetical protein
MRRIFLLAMVPSVFAFGCGDPDAGKLFADIQYATRCDATPHCGAPQERDICGINQGDPCNESGEPVRASCTVTEGDGTRTLSFSASQGDDFSIAVTNATFPAEGGSASGGCTVTVQEGANAYRGACGSSEPSEAQPCRVNSVMFFDDMGNPTVEGAIFCQFLPNRASPELEIEVTALGSGPGPASTPARFRLANCAGLEIPTE